MYSRVRNKHSPMFIKFWKSYYGLKRLKFYYISLHILRGYVYFFLSNFPEATFIQGAAFIPDSRVGAYIIDNILAQTRINSGTD